MAMTTFATTDAERVQRWATRIWIEMPREIYFGRFMKEDPNAIIEVKRDLEGQPGDKLTYTLLNKLDGAGVSGDDTLEGNEEQMVYASDSLTLDQRRNAVRLKGKLSEKRTAFDQRDNARTVLKTWLAETIDDNIFTNLDASPTNTVFGGSAISVATLTTAGTITPALMDKCVAKADKADPKIWPVNIMGDTYFVLLMHTDVWYDLRQNSTWQGYQQQGAQDKAMDNPIFNGSPGRFNRTILHVHEKVPVATNGGSGGDVPYASNFFLGRQAGIFAWGAKPQAWSKEFDYGNSIGFAIGAIWAFDKASFTPAGGSAADHASISLRVARTNN